MHYHCGANTPGYLPEGDVYRVETKGAARAALRDAVHDYREEQRELPANQQRTGHGSAREGYFHFERPGDTYDLGLSFWWRACDDDCSTEED